MIRYLSIAALMVTVFLLTGMALEEEGAAAEAVKLPGVLKGILNGIFGGALAVFLGWAKNKNTATGNQEKFDIKYAWPTLIIGAIIGIIAHFMGLTPEGLVSSVESSPIFTAVIVGAEMLWKVIFRQTAPMVREALDAIKNAGRNPTPPAPPEP